MGADHHVNTAYKDVMDVCHQIKYYNILLLLRMKILLQNIIGFVEIQKLAILI